MKLKYIGIIRDQNDKGMRSALATLDVSAMRCSLQEQLAAMLKAFLHLALHQHLREDAQSTAQTLPIRILFHVLLIQSHSACGC